MPSPTCLVLRLGIPLLLTLAAAVCRPFKGQAQTESPSFESALVLWQGFSHEWTYNHRIGRIGDWVEFQSNKRFRLQHSAAGGRGPDQALFQNFYGSLLFNGGAALSGEVEFTFEGKEKEELQLLQSVTFKAPPPLQGLDNYAVFLNGFDLISEESADRIQLLEVRAGSGGYNPSDSTLTFDIDAKFIANCPGLRCPWFNNSTKYKLKVYYIVLGGEYSAFRTTMMNLRNAGDWDKNDPGQAAGASLVALPGDTSQIWAAGIVGFKSFRILLDEAHKMKDWHLQLAQENYNPMTGLATVRLNFSFRQWAEAMKNNAVSKWHGYWAGKKPGAFEIQADVMLLQVEEGCFIPGKNQGTMDWPGKNTLPTSDEADYSLNSGLPLNCD